MDAVAIGRAARFPFLILDVHFTDVEWWRSNSKLIEASPWPAAVSKPLMSETLVFAWHTVKWDRRVARLGVGMVPAVAELIAALTPHQLDSLSQEHCGALRLRWQDDQEFWSRLLTAACNNDEETLADTHLHAKLLLSGGLIALRQ